MSVPRSVVARKVGRRTESGCSSGLVRTRRGQRKSFHEAITAKTETTPRMGLLIGRTIDQKSRNGPAPSTRAASSISIGRLSKKRFISTTLKALAPAGSQTAQYVLSSDPAGPGGSRIVRYNGTRRTTPGMNNVARTAALSKRA